MIHNPSKFYQNLDKLLLISIENMLKKMLIKYPKDRGFKVMYEKCCVEIAVRELLAEDRNK